jgi:hypothetical protein
MSRKRNNRLILHTNTDLRLKPAEEFRDRRKYRIEDADGYAVNAPEQPSFSTASILEAIYASGQSVEEFIDGMLDKPDGVLTRQDLDIQRLAELIDDLLEADAKRKRERYLTILGMDRFDDDRWR